MTDSQKFITGLLLGAAAGAALAIFISSDKGQEIMADAKSKAEDLADDIKNKVSDFDDQFGSLIQKGKSFVEELS